MTFFFCIRRQQTQTEQLSDADIEFQEQLIQEREGEIEQIEQGITELNQIFKDLGQIVGEQQSMIGASRVVPYSASLASFAGSSPFER